jgi:hypothetical protein
MAHNAPLSTLEMRYARAQGNYETAAHGRETIVGSKALAASAARVAEVQRRCMIIMEDTARTIRQRYDPDWTAGHIKPIYFRQGKKPSGQVSRLAYAVMRKAPRPMTTSEIAKNVAVELEVDTSDQREMTRLVSAVHSTFQNRIQDGMIVRLDENPIRWALVPMPERKLSAAARTLAIREKQSAALPPPRPFETADRC